MSYTVTDSAGVPICYETAGHGPPIVLVHGYLSSFEGQWRQSGWVEFLVGHGRSVIGVDMRGHGKSGKPHDPEAYEDPRMADDVLAVMDAAGVEQVDLMGYSMGGSVAIALLARVPSRFTSVIVGGAGIPEGPPDLKFSAAVAAALMTDDLSTITDPTALFFRQFAESRAHDPKSIATLDPDLHALAAVAKRSHGLRSVLADHVAALPRVDVPVLAVVGDRDSALDDAQPLQATLPSTQLVAIPDDDHVSAISSEAYKDAVLAFLELRLYREPPTS